MTEARYQEQFEQSRVYSFVGTLGESHRLFVLPADLFHEGSEEHRKMLAAWDPALETMLKFFNQQNGLSHVVITFDGRSRQCRRKMEAILEGRRIFLAALGDVYPVQAA